MNCLDPFAPSIKLAVTLFAAQLAVAFSPTVRADAQTLPAHPNVLLIIDDDLCTTIGAYGGPALTPNLDKFARRAEIFQRAYAQYPVCNPSRASFLTGWRPEKTGIFNNQEAVRLKFPDFVSLPQYFRQNGYFTAGIGKIFHIGVDANGRTAFFQDPKSWDYFADHLEDTTPLGKQGTQKSPADGKLKWCYWRAADGGDNDQPDGQNYEEVQRLLAGRRDKPFFIALGLHKPHDPYIAPRKYYDLYPIDGIQLAQQPSDRTPDKWPSIPNQNEWSVFKEMSRQQQLEFKRSYLACESFMDAQVGKLLDRMDSLHLWGNTIVIFMSDNGYQLGEHDWWNKVTLFERGVRVPFIVWAPGGKGMGRTTTAITELVDLYPTLIDLCGLPPRAGLDGGSFRPVLENPELPGKKYSFSLVARNGPDRRLFHGRTVRSDKWRYTEWDGGKWGTELYEVGKDPQNYYNLVNNPAYAGVVTELKAQLAGERFAGGQATAGLAQASWEEMQAEWISEFKD